MAHLGKVFNAYPEHVKDLKLLEKIDLQNFDRLYEYTENSAKEAIIDSRKIPRVLFSRFDSGSLGQSSTIFTEAAKQYNMLTFRERATLTKQFERIAWYIPEVRDMDFSIKQIYSGNTATATQTTEADDITGE